MNFKDRPIAFVDVETTGCNPDIHEIIDFGCIIMHPYKHTIMYTMDYKINPKYIFTAEPEALAVNGYDPAIWGRKNCDLMSVMKIFSDLSKDAVFCSHNVTFDWGFVDTAFEQTCIPNQLDYHRIDLFTLAYAKLPGLENYKLDSISEYLGLPPEPKPHCAYNGAKQAYEVFIRLME